MASYTDLIAGGYGLGDLPNPPRSTPLGARCAITGSAITEGYPVMDIISDAQGEWLETFGGQYDGWLSVSAARCWILGSNPKKDLRCSKSMAVFGRHAFEPLISQKAADEQGRPSWRDLVRHAWQLYRGEPCAIVLSTDTKKRVWWRGRSGVLGDNTPVLVYDTGYSIFRVVNVDWPLMLADLNIVEDIYTLGFSKSGISTSLFKESKTVESVGIACAIEAEQHLREIRQRDHFIFCLLIAQQKEVDSSQCTSTESLSPKMASNGETATRCTEQFTQGSLFG